MKIYLIIICLALAGCDQVSKSSSGNFQISVDANGNAWVVDTRSGEVKRCWQGVPPVSLPSCYPAIQK